VPLSEHEQRLLEQIEQALYAEDPKFASTVRATDLRTVARRRIRRAAALFVVGLGVLLAGVIFNRLVAGVPVLGVLGFCIMLGSALYGWSQYKRLTGKPELRVAEKQGATEAQTRTKPARRKKSPNSSKSSMVQRMEERFHRRFDER
jgi:hypothetical protein